MLELFPSSVLDAVFEVAQGNLRTLNLGRPKDSGVIVCSVEHVVEAGTSRVA